MHEPDEKKALGKRLADAREVSALSQSEAAKQLGIGKAALSAWEVGRNLPDALMLGRAARVYRVSADALLWGALDPVLMDAARAAGYTLIKRADDRELPSSSIRYTADQKERRAGDRRLPTKKKG